MTERIRATCGCGATLEVESMHPHMSIAYREWQEQHVGHVAQREITAAPVTGPLFKPIAVYRQDRDLPLFGPGVKDTSEEAQHHAVDYVWELT